MLNSCQNSAINSQLTSHFKNFLLLWITLFLRTPHIALACVQCKIWEVIFTWASHFPAKSKPRFLYLYCILNCINACSDLVWFHESLKCPWWRVLSQLKDPNVFDVNELHVCKPEHIPAKVVCVLFLLPSTFMEYVLTFPYPKQYEHGTIIIINNRDSP